MARGKEGKANRKQQRKEAQKAAADMIDGSNDFGPSEDGEEEELELPLPPSQNGGAPVEPDDSDDADENENENELVLPTPKKKKKVSAGGSSADSTKYTNRAAKAAGASTGSNKGIKTTPLILLIMMTATTLIPCLIYASDFLGAFVAKNNVMGSIGYKLGIGQTPKKRVMSFYEKHDPAKIQEVPKILSKYYGDYPKLIKNLERKYQDYGYFLEWEQDEAPMTLAFEQIAETREYMHAQFNIYAPQPIKTATRNIQYNVGKLVKKFKRAWKKTLWPMLEPLFGVPKGGSAQKRKDAQEARQRRAGSSKGTRRKNTEYRDDNEDEH